MRLRELRGRFEVILRLVLATGALLALGMATTGHALAGESESMALSRNSSQIAPYEARFGRTRPVIAVVGENSGTELTDFVIPFGILSRSHAADVYTVATGAGLIRMRPALTIQPDFTVASFNERFPEGADYVIVPAVMVMDKKAPPILVDWIKAQADKGASVVSICDGAFTVAKAGLFRGHRATGHWATQARRERDFPDTEWLKNTRYVADGKVISSAGVTAAIPVSLALVEAIAGRDRAHHVAQAIGVPDWSSEHNSEQFHLSLGVYSLAIRNWLTPQRDIGLPILAGVDEVALALTADAFSRTYRSRAYAVADSSEPIRTLNGLVVVPDRVAGRDGLPRYLRPPVDGRAAASALDGALTDIGTMFGRATARFVAAQMEYPVSR